MNISFDKALLWLLPYLYVVSVAYYWGFWGTLGIDAFNYYPVSDLIKGVTEPLSLTILLTGIFGLGGLITGAIVEPLLQKVLHRFKLKATVVLVTLLVIIPGIGVLFYLKDSPDSSPVELTGKAGRPLFMSFIAIANVIAHIINGYLPKVGQLKSAARFAGIFFLVYMPCEANLEGRGRAKLIQQDRAFDYVIVDSLAGPNKEIYKYLGKAGDYHFLLTRDNKKQVIIPTSKLTPLVIEKFSLADDESKVRFKGYENQLAVFKPKPALPIKSPITTKKPAVQK